jgi:hypothetical protein
MYFLSGIFIGLLANIAVAITIAVQELGLDATIIISNGFRFPQSVPSETEGDFYLAYRPYLYVYNGCEFYPVVDAEGDTG